MDLEKNSAAFDMSYFEGRIFHTPVPHFHEEFDEIWSRGSNERRKPLKDQYAPGCSHSASYPLILSDSSEQAEGFS